MTQRIYCSGPLFSPEEVGGMQAIANVLEAAGYQTFLPHRDGVEPYVLNLVGLPSGKTVRDAIDRAIFALDIYELIECCDAIVCNLNGRVPDEGMIVEAAIAYAAGIPIVFYKHDARAPFSGYDNAMLTALTRGQQVGDVSRIPDAVGKALATERSSVTLSPALQKTVRYGKQVAALFNRLPGTLGKKQWSEAVIQEVLALMEGE